jgi:hypothetical protein
VAALSTGTMCVVVCDRGGGGRGQVIRNGKGVTGGALEGGGDTPAAPVQSLPRILPPQHTPFTKSPCFVAVAESLFAPSPAPPPPR